MGGEMPYNTYEEAAQAYMAMFQAVRDTPPAPAAVVRRGAGDVDAEVLVQQADKIAAVSAWMVPLAGEYLDAPDRALREGMGGQLLAQAAAELQLATELLEIATEEEPAAPKRTTRAARGAALRDAINALEGSMTQPLSGGLATHVRVRRGPTTGPRTVDEAKGELQKTAITSTGAITLQVREFGGDIAFDLIFNTKWALVLDGVSLMHKDVAAKLEELKKGAGALISRALTAAAKTLLNAFDKIMALLGKDAENQARKTVSVWLEKIKEDGKIELFDTLVDKMYRIDGFKEDLGGWLAASTAATAQINLTSTDVGLVADKFIVLVGRMRLLQTVAGLAKLLSFPHVLAIVAGIQIALLAFLVFAGFDFIGYKNPKFPDLAKGVAQVIAEGLALEV